MNRERAQTVRPAILGNGADDIALVGMAMTEPDLSATRYLDVWKVEDAENVEWTRLGPQRTKDDLTTPREDDERQGACEEGELIDDEPAGEDPQREGAEGGRPLKVLGDPMLPTTMEVDRHCLTHVPYRS